MSADVKSVKLIFRLDELIAQVHLGLKALILLVADILSRPPAGSETPGRISGVFFEFDPAPTAWLDRSDLSSFVEQRILQWAMTDAIELVKPLLVGARAACSFFELGGNPAMTSEEWNARVARERMMDERMSKMNMKGRLEKFSRDHPDLKMPPLLSEILEILKMRNCVLHNGGIVTNSYCNEPDALRVRFRRHSMWVKGSAGDREYTQGEILGPGTTWQVRIITAERVWRIGERVELTPQIFVDLCFTVDRFALEMAQALEAFGRPKGIIFEAFNGATERDPGASSSQSKHLEDSGGGP